MSGDAAAESLTASNGRVVTVVVLDTNVWLDLLWFDDRRSRWLLPLLGSGRWRALCDEACRSEWRRVLAYADLKISAGQAATLVARFDTLTEAPVEWPLEHTAPPPRCRDPDDQKFLELAALGKAQLLLSRDDELLRLDRRAHANGLFRVMTPDTARERVDASGVLDLSR